ncbi:MAG: aromatic ring-hydroxylating oxygenase subunit alpha [Heliomarina sp.]|uniref:aromatic ring-hydroxylating oxygenase subunit alpha n=1 Tax=Heliomarina sp. TaxID=2917556 RepID=UPI004059DB4A
MTIQSPTPSPLLDHCPETLPKAAYMDIDWYKKELSTIWSNNWVMVGRAADFPAGSVTRRSLGGADVLVVSDANGKLSAFHNTCRHRGAALCATHQESFGGKLIKCPYHAWSYATDGCLISTGFGQPTADFDKSEHSLFPVSLMEWNGFVFLSLPKDPGPLSPDMGLNALDNWPMNDLVCGHVFEKELYCNWKIFWENYNECLHCPGIHPELSDLVPVYREGVMSEAERKNKPGGAELSPLKEGAQTWTANGQPCGPEFPNLTTTERRTAHNFVTLYPSAFIVAHVDYVRSVTLTPLGPEKTKLRAEWLFLPDTMAAPGFDLKNVTEFATLVMEQDGAACELNQKGIASPAYERGRLMPEEFDIHYFHKWVLAEMGD